MGVDDPSLPERARQLRDLAPTLSLDRLADLAAHLLGARSARVSILGDVAESPAGSLCVPLTDSGGLRLGTLCVHDGDRAWTPADLTTLEQIAGPIAAELELAALLRAYESEQLAWEVAVDAGGIGAFDWDLVTGELRWDHRLLDLFGLDEDTFGGTIEAFNATVHPDDVGAVGLALKTAIEQCDTFDIEYRVTRPDGSLTWITGRGRALPGPDGSALRVLGAAYDTSAVREGEAQVRRVLEAMPSAFYHLDHDWRFAHVNPRGCVLLGWSREALLGGSVWELFPEAVGSDFEVHYRRAVESGESVNFDAYYPAPLDSWYEIRAWPTPDGLSVFFNDITERRRAQEVIEESARRTEVVAAAATALSGTLDPVEAVSQIADAVVPVLADWCIVSLVDREVHPDWRRRTRDVAGTHADPDQQPLLDEYVAHRIPALRDDSYLAAALADARTVSIPTGAADAVIAVLEPGRAQDLARELDPGAALILPLRAGERTVGMLSLYRQPARAPFSVGDQETVAEIAARAGLALDNARLYAEQRELAEGLQRSMMTAPPEPDHLEVEVRYEPAAEAAQVGGDWYDAFLQDDGGTVLVIGDVVGHDTAAAAGMGQVRSLLRGIAVHSGESPAGVLRGVDRVMRTLQAGITATAVVARLEQDHEGDTTYLRWSNAGHLPPLVIDPRGEVVELASTPELLLGLEPDTERSDHVTPIERGSTVLLYTDGLIERRGETIDDGLTLLRDSLAELAAADLPLTDLLDRLLARMLPARPEDDVAVTAVRLHPQDRPRPAEAGPHRVPPGMPPEQ